MIQDSVEDPTLMGVWAAQIDWVSYEKKKRGCNVGSGGDEVKVD